MHRHRLKFKIFFTSRKTSFLMNLFTFNDTFRTSSNCIEIMQKIKLCVTGIIHKIFCIQVNYVFTILTTYPIFIGFPLPTAHSIELFKITNQMSKSLPEWNVSIGYFQYSSFSIEHCSLNQGLGFKFRPRHFLTQLEKLQCV